MKTSLTILLAMTVGLACNAPASEPCEIVLLPIEQNGLPSSQRLSYVMLHGTLQSHTTQYPEIRLATHMEIMERFNRSLVDSAVFELLISDSLDKTLAKLEQANTTKNMLQLFRDIPGQKPDYVITTRILPARTHWHVSFAVKHLASGKSIFAYTFSDLRKNPLSLCKRISTNLNRGLWQISVKCFD